MKEIIRTDLPLRALIIGLAAIAPVAFPAAQAGYTTLHDLAYLAIIPAAVLLVLAWCRAALKSRILRIASSFLSLKSRTVRDFALKSRTNFLPPKGSGALNCSRLQDRWKTGILTLRS